MKQNRELTSFKEKTNEHFTFVRMIPRSVPALNAALWQQQFVLHADKTKTLLTTLYASQVSSNYSRKNYNLLLVSIAFFFLKKTKKQAMSMFVRLISQACLLPLLVLPACLQTLLSRMFLFTKLLSRWSAYLWSEQPSRTTQTSQWTQANVTSKSCL